MCDLHRFHKGSSPVSFGSISLRPYGGCAPGTSRVQAVAAAASAAAMAANLSMTTEQQITAAAQAAIASGQGVLSQDAWQHFIEEGVLAGSQSSLTARESEIKQLGRVATSSCECCWGSGSGCSSSVGFVPTRAGTATRSQDSDMLRALRVFVRRRRLQVLRQPLPSAISLAGLHCKKRGQSIMIS